MPQTTDFNSLKEILHKLGSNLSIDTDYLSKKVGLGCTNEMSMAELLTLTAETASSLVTKHPDWDILGGRILTSEIELRTPSKFSSFVAKQKGLLTKEFVDFVEQHADILDACIDHSQDNNFGFFAMRTLQHSYLREHERLQYMWMRVAVAIHMPDLDLGLQSYRLMSQKYFIHATPTLFNAGCHNGQLASCFLMAMKSSSVDGIFETLKDCAIITHNVGGIGLHCSNISAEDAGGKTESGAIVPMLRVFNNTSRFVGQGGNKRPGAISVTLEPWHSDIFSFLDLKKPHGKEEYRARDLFYALWVPDLFMRKVKDDEDWYLFSPNEAPGLQDCYGEEFDNLYMHYVDSRRYRQHTPARKLWHAILDCQIETGNPSLLYKDSCNMKSNQKNLGTIKSSNLCTEIIEYSSADETAVCNLASLGLPTFINKDKKFDMEKLHEVTKVVIKNLNRTIDVNYYPLKSCESNLKHRPLALGVQGLADVFFKLRIPFASPEAAELNRNIFETIYHGSLEASMELAREFKKTYESFNDSPTQKGKLQFDLWGVEVNDDLWNWSNLRKQIAQHGVYNSLLTAVMPTASTSQIFGFTESIEPLTSNIYSRRTLSGEFQVINRYLVEELEILGLWTDKMREEIIAFNGSIQHIDVIPHEIRAVYKTIWEISMKTIIDQSVGRSPFIDQSQSLNLFLSQPTHRQLTSMHFNSWSRGLKTGLYYLRTQPAVMPIPFTVSYESRKRHIDYSNGHDGNSSKKSSSTFRGPSCEACT